MARIRHLRHPRHSWMTPLIRLAQRAGGDRGDVPGWVLITVMTAGLVTALWILADHQLTAVFSRAIEAVSSP